MYLRCPRRLRHHLPQCGQIRDYACSLVQLDVREIVVLNIIETLDRLDSERGATFILQINPALQVSLVLSAPRFRI